MRSTTTLVFCVLSCAAAADAQEWYREDPSRAPVARRFHGMAFDAHRGVTVLFGGADEPGGRLLDDTWEFDGRQWHLRAQSGPGARHRFAICFDAIRGTVLVFGGEDAQGQVLDDTWEWDGRHWSCVTTSAAPSPRMDAAMVFDEARGDVLLFGGRTDVPATSLGDTWRFDGAGWTQITTSVAPDPRYRHTMVFDVARGRTVLFGGFANGANGASDDTWEFDGIRWHAITTATTPTGGVFPAMAFHRAHGVTVLVGATGTVNPPLQTWVYDGIDWQRGPAAPAGFVGRQGHGMVFDTARDTMVLFGGASIAFGGARPHDDTWELGDRARIEVFGTGCSTSAGRLELVSRDGERPQLGHDLVLDAGSVPPRSMTTLLLGFDDAAWAGLALPFELAPFGMPGCSLLVAIDATEPMVAGSGVASHTLRVPLDRNLILAELLAQAITLGAESATSNGVRLVLGN